MSFIEDIRSSMDWDSSILKPWFAEDRHHFEYFLILRLYLEQVNHSNGKATFKAPDNDGNEWAALRWNKASWDLFKDKYKQRVKEVWDKAFVLIPPDSYRGFMWPDEKGTRRNLLCRLRISFVDKPEGAHAVIKVVRLANPTAASFRSNTYLYDSDDVNLKPVKWKGVTYQHNTPAHEVGHLLQLWHFSSGNSGCNDQADHACYGSNLYERMNVMGSGGMLDLSQALPWIRRIPEHVQSTKKDDWKVDWASNEAMLRGMQGMKVEEWAKMKTEPAKPGLIDL